MGFSAVTSLELLKIVTTRFASYHLTFRRLLKVSESLASMVSSKDWQVLKDKAPIAIDKQGFEEVETTALDDQPTIGEVYEKIDNMLEQIKDILQEKDPNLYDIIHKFVCAGWNKLNVPLHALAYILMPKYHSPSWLGKPPPRVWVRAKPHTYLEVQNEYMSTLDKLVTDREECANLHLELGRYSTSIGVFGSLHAMEDRDKFDAITWWDAYGDQGLLPKLATKVLSRDVNISSTERCWSTYSFIHNVRRNRLNENWAKSLVYVHYNLRLLIHYYDRARDNTSYTT
eukprot:PITA_34519